MSDPVPSDYDASDSFDGEAGWEMCAYCEQSLWPEKFSGPVYTQAGKRYEHFTDTDPGELPLFCPDCWDELETNRRAAENAAITEWS